MVFSLFIRKTTFNTMIRKRLMLELFLDNIYQLKICCYHTKLLDIFVEASIIKVFRKTNSCVYK